MKIIHCDGLDGYITRLDWRNGVPHPDAGPIERAVRFSDSDAQAFMDYLHRDDRMLFSVENAPESAVNHEILSLLWDESDDDGTLQESRMRDRARRELCDMLARERADEDFHAVVKARGWDYLIEEQN